MELIRRYKKSNVSSLPSYIRVANVIEEARLGGPQARIMRVANALRDRVETTVVMPEESSECFRTQCDALVLPYKALKMRCITKDWKMLLRYMIFFPSDVVRLARFFREKRFDLVHVSGGSWQCKGVIAGKLAGIVVLWHLNDTSMPWIVRKLFRLLSVLPDGYIYSANRAKDYYGSLIKGKRPGFVIAPPVDVSYFDPSQPCYDNEELIAQLADKMVIGMVANINPMKGLDVFVRAAAMLNENFGNLCFLVIGPVYSTQQEYFQTLQKLCSKLLVDNIKFVGRCADVRSLLKRVDVYVCSSNAETGPMSLWEAMAMAKPVVTTDVGDVTLYVRDGHNGFVVSVGDSEAMAEKLGRLIASEKMRKEFGARSRYVATQELNLEHCAQLHWNAYTNLLMGGYLETGVYLESGE